MEAVRIFQFIWQTGSQFQTVGPA